MNKDVTICFRTKAKLRDALKKIAVRQKRTLSSLIENVVVDFLEEQKALKGLSGERRRHRRKQIAIPVMINEYGSEEKEYFAGTIVDISLQGIRIAISEESRQSLVSSNYTPTLELLFALPERSRPMQFKCIPCRIAENGDHVQIAAVFSDADFTSFQGLQNYLV